MENRKKILIAEDHTILREGLKSLLLSSGDLLGISPKTVEKHRANLMEKLDRHNVSELTAYAIEKGLVVK